VDAFKGQGHRIFLVAHEIAQAENKGDHITDPRVFVLGHLTSEASFAERELASQAD
jgi:hypothetical protein